jgi:lipopolysaccharide/colanic/teichoic acid biosynthesis glycosyltransferase
VKRALDAALATVFLILLSPLLLLLALLVKLQDAGPVFYRRRVVGPKGEFDAFKLRTMRADADEILARDSELLRAFEINFKLKDDPRVTALGAVLRKLSLDELPQLWNVLVGEMSLVGPRMITPAEVERYGEAAWIFRSVKPGLTGYWQIEGRQDVSYARRIQMDVYYVENWSLALDVKILFKTPWRAIRGSGAY